ncbi:hypothetical protein HMPREF0653_01076 [Prevotella disiens JCM 6334 = ATCC 29426]|uniref:Transposase n=1 Tax=Prevotella disiens JCM 6334 = ATCC 29426 TaxID=1235811 RepID=A0ABN0NSV8_9BACT|nr:hypothetical protein HMPREF0653_01076 [Prevotella disiens JCM 6334 = ATCC 29426]
MFFDASNIDVFALYKGVQWIIQACIKQKILCWQGVTISTDVGTVLWELLLPLYCNSLERVRYVVSIVLKTKVPILNDKSAYFEWQNRHF